jgi:hypothetical protein
MQNELANDESPMDANLQSVLPGLHQRLEVQREEISCLCGDVGRLTVAVKNHTLVFNKKVDDKMEVLGRMHIMVSSRLLGKTVEEMKAHLHQARPQALLQGRHPLQDKLVKGMRLPGITWSSPLRPYSLSTTNGMGEVLIFKIYRCQGASRIQS